MSPRYSQSAGAARPANPQPAGDEGRPFTTGIGGMVSPAGAQAAPPPAPPPAIGPDEGTDGDPEAVPAGDAVPGTGLDEPLLSDAGGLRARWQRVQAGFVDDPQEAVGEAAGLIEQTAQAMVSAVRQRQRQLRAMGESGQDTEHLRQMMRHYQVLFNQLCGP